MKKGDHVIFYVKGSRRVGIITKKSYFKNEQKTLYDVIGENGHMYIKLIVIGEEDGSARPSSYIDEKLTQVIIPQINTNLNLTNLANVLK